jgi:hypothetical protein
MAIIYISRILKKDVLVMGKDYSRSRNLARYWILLGIPVIIVISSIMHFVYEWSGKLVLVGIFAPVNESVWEHLKMAFWPMLLWWFIGYILYHKKSEFSTSKWIISGSMALIATLIIITSFYYAYTGAFGFKSLFLDVFSLLLSVVASQILAAHVYRFAKQDGFRKYLALFAVLLLIVAFTLFTFITPHYPIFKDSLTGKYGI